MREWLLGLRFRLLQQLNDVDGKLSTLSADIAQAKQMASSSNDSYQPTPGNGAAKQGEHPK